MASLGIRVKLMLLRSPNLNKNTNSKKETCGYWNQNVFCYKTQDMAQVVQKFKGQPWSQTLIFIAWFPQSTFETWEVFILTDERAKSQSLSDIAKALRHLVGNQTWVCSLSKLSLLPPGQKTQRACWKNRKEPGSQMECKSCGPPTWGEHKAWGEVSCPGGSQARSAGPLLTALHLTSSERESECQPQY